MTFDKHETCRRLWKEYFPHMTETVGCGLVWELLKMHNPEKYHDTEN